MARTFATLVATTMVELRRGPVGNPDLASDDADFVRRALIDKMRDYRVQALPRLETSVSFTPTALKSDYKLKDAPILTRFTELKLLRYEDSDGSLVPEEGMQPSSWMEVSAEYERHAATQSFDEVEHWRVEVDTLWIAPRPSGNRIIHLYGRADNDYGYQWNDGTSAWEYTKNGAIQQNFDALTDAIWFDHLGDLLVAGAAVQLLEGPFVDKSEQGSRAWLGWRAREKSRRDALRTEHIQSRGRRLKPHL